MLQRVGPANHSPETPRHLGKEMVECIVKGVADSAPDVRVVSAEEFHRVVFGARPGEVLLRADTIVSLLSRPEIKQRVEDSGLTHLILVAAPSQPKMRCVASESLGMSASTRMATPSTRWALKLLQMCVLVRRHVTRCHRYGFSQAKPRRRKKTRTGPRRAATHARAALAGVCSPG